MTHCTQFFKDDQTVVIQGFDRFSILLIKVIKQSTLIQGESLGLIAQLNPFEYNFRL